MGNPFDDPAHPFHNATDLTTGALTSTKWDVDTARQAVRDHSCFQHPVELAQLLTYLRTQVKPVTVLEIGGGEGGSAWAWGQLPTVTHVVTVTLPNPGRRWLCCPMPARHWAYLGDSTHHDTVHALTYHLTGQPIDFLWIDGDHSYHAVSRDWDLYSPLVRPGGLIGLHDIVPEHRWPGFEVDLFWAEIKHTGAHAELIADPAAGMGTGLIWRPR